MPENQFENRAFLFGDGVFETIRYMNGQLFFPQDHWERLFTGMDTLEFRYVRADFLNRVKQAVRERLAGTAGQGHGRIRITVFRGGGGAYTPESDTPEFVVAHKPLPMGFGPKSMRIGRCDQWEVAPGPLSQIKSLNALPYVMAAKYAQSHNWDDVVLSHKGFVSETSRANIMVRFSDEIYVPGPEQGALPGTMMKKVKDWAKLSGFHLKQKKIATDALTAANEIILTNAIMGVAGVNNYNGKAFPGENGPLYSALLAHLLKAQPESI